MTLAQSNAFPEDTASQCLLSGLTKREYFAISCLQSLIVEKYQAGWAFPKAVEESVQLADLLIAELNKE